MGSGHEHFVGLFGPIRALLSDYGLVQTRLFCIHPKELCCIQLSVFHKVSPEEGENRVKKHSQQLAIHYFVTFRAKLEQFGVIRSEFGHIWSGCKWAKPAPKIESGTVWDHIEAL